MIFQYMNVIESIEYDLTGLPSPYNSPDLVVFHSTYIPTHFKIANHLKKKKIPYIYTTWWYDKRTQSLKNKRRLGYIIL